MPEMVEALDAVKSCARELGLDVEDAIVLRATNNTVAWLAPLPVVAKIAAGHHGRLAAEIEVARLLAAAGAPVVPPADGITARVYRAGRFEMTFWRYEDQDRLADPGSAPVARALAGRHRALRGLGPAGGRWPRFDEELRGLQRRLDDAHFAPELDTGDRNLLRSLLDDRLARLRAQAPGTHVLHGSPHRLNILAVDGSPRFIDFETVCQGPLEWDLAHLEPEVARHYPLTLDDEVLRPCRVLASAKTAAWCWHSIHAGPDMRFHAEHHLQVLREARP